jgi:hypothetical protein
VADIKGGSQQAIQVGSSLILDASNSFDRDMNPIIGNKSNLEGFGILFNDFKQSNFRYNNFLCYKAIISEKHTIKIDLFENMLNSKRTAKINEMVISYFNVSSFGYGYLIWDKKIDITLLGQLSYRSGSEMVILVDNTIYDFDNFAFFLYNSYGFSTGLDIEYFFTKNIALGTNIYYYNFPFETNKLSGSNVEITHPDFVKTYRPVSDFLNINFKLAYKFSFPKFKKKNNV